MKLIKLEAIVLGILGLLLLPLGCAQAFWSLDNYDLSLGIGIIVLGLALLWIADRSDKRNNP